jgi:hypothetical protein
LRADGRYMTDTTYCPEHVSLSIYPDRRCLRAAVLCRHFLSGARRGEIAMTDTTVTISTDFRDLERIDLGRLAADIDHLRRRKSGIDPQRRSRVAGIFPRSEVGRTRRAHRENGAHDPIRTSVCACRRAAIYEHAPRAYRQFGTPRAILHLFEVYA